MSTADLRHVHEAWTDGVVGSHQRRGELHVDVVVDGNLVVGVVVVIVVIVVVVVVTIVVVVVVTSAG